MDSSRFDAWTRRRFGLTVGGAAASAMGLAQVEVAGVKKKKKKRCKRLGQGCNPGAKRKCCKKQDLICGEPRDDLGGFRCCKDFGTECNSPEECCGGLACFGDPVLGGPKECRTLVQA